MYKEDVILYFFVPFNTYALYLYPPHYHVTVKRRAEVLWELPVFKNLCLQRVHLRFSSVNAVDTFEIWSDCPLPHQIEKQHVSARIEIIPFYRVLFIYFLISSSREHFKTDMTRLIFGWGNWDSVQINCSVSRSERAAEAHFHPGSVPFPSSCISQVVLSLAGGRTQLWVLNAHDASSNFSASSDKLWITQYCSQIFL